MNYYKSIFKIASILFLVLVSSCNIEPFEGELPEESNNPDPTTCVEAVQNTAEAGTAFSSTSSSDLNYAELCSAYKKALQDQVLVCGDGGGVYQALVDSLGNCEGDVIESENCEQAITVSLDAENAFSNADDSNYASLCNTYKLALQNQISLCGDDDNNLQIIIDDLGDCVQNEVMPSIRRALMTANIGGEQFDNLKPYFYPVTYASIVSWFSFASDAEAYLTIQGNSAYQTSPLPSAAKEINLLIPERNWKEGTFDLAPYITSEDDSGGVTPHVHFINGIAVSDIYTESLPGSVTITKFSLTERIIQGEFEFNYKLVSQIDASEEGPYKVTGTFDYSLDDEFFD